MSILNFSLRFEEPLRLPDFDPKVLRPAFRKMGSEVAKISRKLVSKRGVSSAGRFPGRTTGGLKKTIKARVSKSGFSVAIKSYPGSMPEFYPAYVYYGHRAPKTDNRKQHGKKRVGRKVAAPRANWIVAAAERYGREKYQAQMRVVLEQAIKPGLVEGLVSK